MKRLFFLIFLATGCVTKKQILSELRSYRASQDSIFNHQKIMYSYEKARIDSVYNHISDDDLLRRIDALTRPKSKN